MRKYNDVRHHRDLSVNTLWVTNEPVRHGVLHLRLRLAGAHVDSLRKHLRWSLWLLEVYDHFIRLWLTSCATSDYHHYCVSVFDRDLRLYGVPVSDGDFHRYGLPVSCFIHHSHGLPFARFYH
jgi:hypothetical protein